MATRKSNNQANQSNQSNNNNRKNIVENSKLCNALVAQYASNHTEEEVRKYKGRIIGNNGYPIGKEFMLTGEVKLAKNVDGYEYPALVTTDGIELSAKILLNVSSDKGYITDNVTELISEYYVNNDKENKLTKIYKSNLIKNFDFSKVYQPITRNYLEFIALLENGTIPIKDKKVIFYGTIIKQFIAKTDNSFGNENWGAGYKRVIETQLWGLKQSPFIFVESLQCPMATKIITLKGIQEKDIFVDEQGRTIKLDNSWIVPPTKMERYVMVAVSPPHYTLLRALNIREL